MPNIWEIITALFGLGILGALIYVGRKLQILDDLHETTGKIKNNLKVVCDHLINDENFDHTELQTYSPLQLTQKGELLIKEMAFDRVFAEHKKDFYDFIKEEHPKLKHDVESAAIKSIYTLGDQKDYMAFLKKFFYNNPNRNLANTAPTLGVYVRDHYLNDHPDIKE